MKNKTHILILLAVLLVGGMIVSPVSAVEKWTYYIDGGDVVTGDSLTHTPDSTICARYGKTAYAGYNDRWTYIRGQYYPSMPNGTPAGLNWYYYTGSSANCNSYAWMFTNASPKVIDPKNLYAACTGNDPTGIPWANVALNAFNGYSLLEHATCNDGAVYSGRVFHVYNVSPIVAPAASFTCSPVSQFPDKDVICTDTSSNTPTTWLWTLDYEALGIKGWQTSTSRNFTWQSHYTGIFGVNLRANNSAGGSWYNRSNYVEISNNVTPKGIDDPIPAGYIRSIVQCVNPEDSSLISDCAISIKDIEGTAWSNGSFHGTWFIDTLPLHHINAYGSSSGYTSASRLNLDASSSLMYELFLFPGYLPPAANGHVRLYAIVNDYTTGAPVLNAQVEFKGSGESTQIKYTSISGIAEVEWVNKSTVYISASKAGYSPASRTIVTTSTGPDTVRLELSAPWVTLPVTSGTPLPGELTVRPTQDSNKNPDGSYVTGYSNIKGQEMMNWLAEHGFQLVQLCFFVTILGLLGVKLGGK